MKKILLLCVLMAVAGTAFYSYGQTQPCGAGNITRWDGTGLPGDSGLAHAGTPNNLFGVNGNILDWTESITGPLNPAYAGVSPPTYQPDPFASPVAPANVQIDGLAGGTGGNYDRDRPGQDHRDLRYFAFTYDRANIYFFIRRPANNNAQVAYYYFVDINVDGYMRTGEPVLKVTYNGSSASIEMMYYIEEQTQTNCNAPAAGAYVVNQGNIMVAPVARAGNATTSEWVVGSADGWSMPGDVNEAAVGQLPALSSVNGIVEVFSAAAVTDGPNTGYAVEFVVPWNYLRLYDGAGAAPVITGYDPLTYADVFTWHVSVDNGAGSSSCDDEDNAGGCCSGLALSGAADVNPGAKSVTGQGPNQYRLSFQFTEQRGVSTRILLNEVEIDNIFDIAGNPIPDGQSSYTMTVYADANCDGTPEGAGTAYVSDGDVTTTTYVPDAVPPHQVISPASGSACFLVDINFGGPPFVKSADITARVTAEFNITSINCELTTTGSEISLLEFLPVKYHTFNARRDRQDVDLSWQTATEQHNAGFIIERRIGLGGWENIGFVATKAPNGTSTTLLSYEFTDLNNTTKGISQYRLKQVDINQRVAYSDVRAVRGSGQRGNTIVYPNPTNDGKVSVVFEESNIIRNVSLLDMNGRMLKQWRNISNNTIQIDNLTPGFYSVRIENTSTGEQTVEKIVVNKR